MNEENSGSLLAVKIEKAGASPVVRVTGEIDMHTVPVLHDGVEGLLPQCSEGLTLLMDEVRFIDSTGIRELLRIKRNLRDAGATLSLVSPTAAVSRVLKVTGLENEFLISADGV